MIFNSKNSDKTSNIRVASRRVRRPAQINQEAATLAQAAGTVQQTVEVTKRRRKEKYEEAPYGIFQLTEHEPHTSASPGKINGAIHVVTSDVDGDGILDRDELGQPKASTLRKRLERGVESGEYSVMQYPYLSLSGLPRVQKFMRKHGLRTLPTYVHRSHQDAIGTSHDHTVTQIDRENLTNQLAAAAKAGKVFFPSRKDINDPLKRMMVEDDGFLTAIAAHFTDQKPSTNDIDARQHHCVCGTHRDNHDRATCSTFLPMMVRDESGNLVDGNTYRSERSPLRVPVTADGSSATLARLGATGIDKPEPDRANAEQRVLVTTQTPWRQRLMNVRVRSRRQKSLPDVSMTAARDPRLVDCKTCSGTTGLYEAAEGMLWSKEMLSGMHTYVPVIDPVTGKKSLEKQTVPAHASWAVRGTPDNVCPDCDHRNITEEELEAIASSVPTGHAPMTADQVYTNLINNPGKVYKLGVQSVPTTRGFVRQEQAVRSGNPIIRVDSPVSGGIAYGAPKSDCKVCDGNHDYRKDGMPCDCSIGDPSKFSSDNPVLPPGSPDIITPTGDILINPMVLREIIKEHHEKTQKSLFGDVLTDPVTIVDHDMAQGERFIPNDQITGKEKNQFATTAERDKKYNDVRRKGNFGTGTSIIGSDGKPLLSDDQQKSAESLMSPGIVITEADSKMLREERKRIMSSPNAAERGVSDQARFVINFLSNNIDRLPSAAGTPPPTPVGAKAIPQNMDYVDPTLIAGGDIDVRSPMYSAMNKSIMPHVARIQSKVAGLKKQGLLDPEIDADLQGIFNIASQAADQWENLGAVSVGTPGSPGYADQLISGIQQLSQNHINRRGAGKASQLNTILPEIKEMIHPYLPEESLT